MNIRSIIMPNLFDLLEVSQFPPLYTSLHLNPPPQSVAVVPAVPSFSGPGALAMQPTEVRCHGLKDVAHGVMTRQDPVTSDETRVRGHGWMDGWMGGWMDEWMDGWMDGRMDGWTDLCFCSS